MIPWGQFHPDSVGINTPALREARNCLPGTVGFGPLKSPVAASNALPSACFGGATVMLADGSNKSVAATATNLYRLEDTGAWTDVSRTTGGPYATGTGERVRFEMFGNTLISTNLADVPQKYDISLPTGNFSALGGSPPQARYIAVVRDFLVLGSILNNERRVQWSGINNSEFWTPGSQSSDFQDFPSGGPVRGIIGGETGYVFQAEKITRMTFVPGSSEIFQFDEVADGRGLAAPHSLVTLANEAFYFGGDGFYRFNRASGGSQPIGVGKWSKWFLDTYRSGTELSILSAVAPRERVILWPFVSVANSGNTADKVLIYDWALDEATFADIPVEAAARWLTQGVSLDTMDSFGDLDALGFSLDSPFWRGGGLLAGLFGSDHKLAHLQGVSMQAQFVTSDGQAQGRQLIKGTRPAIDTPSVTVEIAARERDGDAVVYAAAESMEDTGIVPAWVSGNVARARVTVAAGANWSVAQGLETITGARGRR